MKDNYCEYEILRTEIVQNLQNYQNVRNMMYIVTITTLGYALSNNDMVNGYLFLLPLIIIMPSFMVSVDYLKCVTKLCAYLKVFHESSCDSPYHWENRQSKWAKEYNYHQKLNIQHIPYMVSAGTCILLYFNKIYEHRNDLSFIVGIVIVVLCIYLFATFQNINRKD